MMAIGVDDAMETQGLTVFPQNTDAAKKKGMIQPKKVVYQEIVRAMWLGTENGEVEAEV
jgi:hypothetical protein